MRKILAIFSALLLLGMFFYSVESFRDRGDAELALLDYVIDGDSLAVTIEGKPHIFRLLDIDAPEHGEPFSEQASELLKSQLERGLPLYYYKGDYGLDVYGRMLVLVWRDKPAAIDRAAYLQSLNAELVRQGLALPEKYKVSTSFYSALEALRKEAEQQKKGVHQ